MRQQHIVRRLVLRVQLEDSALEILYGVGLAVEVALLLELVGDRKALLCNAAMLVEVREEGAAEPLAGLLKFLVLLGDAPPQPLLGL